MNNQRLLAGLLAVLLPSGGLCTYASTPRVMTIEELFEIAETRSVQLRPSFSAEEEAQLDINVARSQRLPDINATLSLSYIGDGFITRRNFKDYEKAPIPHFGNGLGVTVTQPVYTGGAITSGIELAELKSTASRYATDLQRDNIRFRLAGFYLDLYKYANLRKVVESNISQARKVLDEMNARYEEGVALRNDITRYELLISNLELQLIRINNTLDILNNNLVTTAGLEQGTVIEPDTTTLHHALPCSSEHEWQQVATENAPSLKLADTEVALNRKAEY
ncbi:MAG: TolC family protein [Muribaculaceae bacterium]|nr:TolC family protein [Muribaculaceae bacterium]